MRIAAALFIVFCLLTAVPAHAEVRYTGAAVRDPFSADPSKQRRAPAVDEATSIEKQLQTMTIEGLVASSKNPRAIINGKIYRIGEEIKPGLKIKHIDKSGVLLASSDKEMLLTQQKKRKPTDESAKKA